MIRRLQVAGSNPLIPDQAGHTAVDMAKGSPFHRMFDETGKGWEAPPLLPKGPKSDGSPGAVSYDEIIRTHWYAERGADK